MYLFFQFCLYCQKKHLAKSCILRILFTSRKTRLLVVKKSIQFCRISKIVEHSSAYRATFIEKKTPTVLTTRQTIITQTILNSFMYFRYMDNNLISEVPENSFKSLKMLRSLRLNANLLKEIPVTALNQARNLRAM